MKINAIKAALARLANACTGWGPANECPILEGLDSQEGMP